MRIRTLIKKITPKVLISSIQKILLYYRKFILQKKIETANNNYSLLVDDVKKKRIIKVAFFLLNVDTWKLNILYNEFDKDIKFEPIVVICPFITKGQEFLDNELKKGIEYCKIEGYKYTVAYNSIDKTTNDIKTILKPDIVFFTNPNALTSKEFLIDNYLDTLTCYVPYSFRIDTLYEYEYNNRMVNLVWLNFYETNIHKDYAMIYALNRGKNVIVSGFPFLDEFKKTKTKKASWKSYDNRKRIVWAPHWTIKGFNKSTLDWACFLDYCNLFLELANEFKNDIQLAIKPHPFLKPTLTQVDLWGVEKTKKYFKKWDELENCQLIQGDYKQLFIDSDALIHDSGSFMTEYLALNKPMAYTVSDKDTIDKRFNLFGEIVLNAHSKIYSKKDLRDFIVAIIGGKDSFKFKRENIINEQNINQNRLASKHIVELLKNRLK